MSLSKKVPSFAMLRAFDAFGRTGGIRKAAQALEVDHGVVSRHLVALEAFVGTALIDRSNGTHALTSDGAEYHRRISVAFEDIASATHMLRKRHDQHLLIWCSPGFAYHWLAPRLAAFSAFDAGIGVELRPMDYSPNFTTNEADGDIRYVRLNAHEPPAANTKQVALAQPIIFPVASPIYVATVSERLRTVRDLLDLRLLHEENDSEWRLWLHAQHVDPGPATISGPRLWHAHVMLDAAKTGQGIALANRFLTEDYLASGQLVRVQTSAQPFIDVSIGDYRFVAREDRWASPALARFRYWLSETARGSLRQSRADGVVRG